MSVRYGIGDYGYGNYEVGNTLYSGLVSLVSIIGLGAAGSVIYGNKLSLSALSGFVTKGSVNFGANVSVASIVAVAVSYTVATNYTVSVALNFAASFAAKAGVNFGPLSLYLASAVIFSVSYYSGRFWEIVGSDSNWNPQYPTSGSWVIQQPLQAGWD